MGIHRLLAMGFLCLGLWQAQPLWAEPQGQLEAAFVFNFTKFVTWPAAVEQSGALNLCLYGAGAAAEFHQLNQRKVRQFTLNVQSIESLARISNCQLVYVSSHKDVKSVLNAASDKPILTVANTPGFVDQTGIIGLYLQDNRMRFDINLEQAKSSDLSISSRLLNLAGRVL